MVKKILTLALCAIITVSLCFGVLASASDVESPEPEEIPVIDRLPGGEMEFGPACPVAPCFEKLPIAKGVSSPKTADMTKEFAVVIAIGTLSLACAALYVGKKSA